jgi:uncharacterized UBP type Zn finger protein
MKGAGLVGLKNLGNSCYINSIMQVLFALPEFKARYLDTAADTFQGAGDRSEEDLNVQVGRPCYIKFYCAEWRLTHSPCLYMWCSSLLR